MVSFVLMAYQGSQHQAMDYSPPTLRTGVEMKLPIDCQNQIVTYQLDDEGEVWQEVCASKPMMQYCLTSINYEEDICPNLQTIRQGP